MEALNGLGFFAAGKLTLASTGSPLLPPTSTMPTGLADKGLRARSEVGGRALSVAALDGSDPRVGVSLLSMNSDEKAAAGI
jgi:hypothetical protein